MVGCMNGCMDGRMRASLAREQWTDLSLSVVRNVFLMSRCPLHVVTSRSRRRGASCGSHNKTILIISVIKENIFQNKAARMLPSDY
jgi:hypothetical protein